MKLSPLAKSILLTPFNLLYRLKTGETLHLDDPRTFNEKLQWIKLYDGNPLKPLCVDKYTVRQYVADKGLGDTLNALLWEGFDPGDIPFDRLPDQFVIKVTHGSGNNIICRDKSALDRTRTVAKLRRWLKAKYIPCYGEWFYGKVRPRVIVEALLTNDASAATLDDYKIYCFNGVPRVISLDHGRFTDHHYKDVYDADWNLLPGHELAFRCSGKPVPRPACLDRLLACARILSEDFLHVGVDFYVADGRPVFGELTFCDGAGFDPIRPPEFARTLGDWLELPLHEAKEVIR